MLMKFVSNKSEGREIKREKEFVEGMKTPLI